MALSCKLYENDLPQLGKLCAVNEDNSVTIDWLIGTYSSIFKAWTKKGQQIRETFPRRAIMGRVTLTSGMRLKKDTVVLLKRLYSDFNSVFII